MASTNETVRDVCAEMRKELNQSWWDVDREKIHDIPDRILAAYEREMAAREAELARLKAALKPVLELDMSQFGDEVVYGDCFDAVREAQRIMKEGEPK